MDIFWTDVSRAAFFFPPLWGFVRTLKSHEHTAQDPLEVLMDRQHKESTFTVLAFFNSSIVFPLYC